MMGTKYFYGEIWLIIPQLSLLPFLIWSTAVFRQTNANLYFSVVIYLILSILFADFQNYKLQKISSSFKFVRDKFT